LPSEVLIGSLKKQEEAARTLLGDVAVTIRAFDVHGQFIFSVHPKGGSHTGESKFNVVSMIAT
jgi:hypothetical protein